MTVVGPQCIGTASRPNWLHMLLKVRAVASASGHLFVLVISFVPMSQNRVDHANERFPDE